MRHPSLVVVIGANGAGKTTWARRHRHRLPSNFYNADSIAEGLGDANRPEQQMRARNLVDTETAERLRESFGFESTWSGQSRPAIVRRAHGQGYETQAIFLGTNDVGINIARVRRRVLEGGHDVPEKEITRRWARALENLLATWEELDLIDVLDSSTETVRVIAQKQGRQTRLTVSEIPPWATPIARRADTQDL